MTSAPYSELATQCVHTLYASSHTVSIECSSLPGAESLFATFFVFCCVGDSGALELYS